MILIAGGTGTNGREIVRQLSAMGVPIRALIRNPRGAETLAFPGVETVLGDLSQPETLPRPWWALTGHCSGERWAPGS